MPPLSLHFPSGCASQTHAVLDEKQPLTWGPKRPQHLNSLFFLPPPFFFSFCFFFFAGHEWHCQMLALINLIIRWATHMQARVWLASPAAFLPSLIFLCRQHNQSHTKQDKTPLLTEVIAPEVFLAYSDSHLYFFNLVKIQSEAKRSYRESLTEDQSDCLIVWMKSDIFLIHNWTDESVTQLKPPQYLLIVSHCINLKSRNKIMVIFLTNILEVLQGLNTQLQDENNLRGALRCIWTCWPCCSLSQHVS